MPWESDTFKPDKKHPQEAEIALGLRVLHVTNYLQETHDPRFGGLEWLFNYIKETAAENPIKTAFERVFHYIKTHHPDLYRISHEITADIYEAASMLEYTVEKSIKRYVDSFLTRNRFK